MKTPYALLRVAFPYYMTLGQRRVTSSPIDVALGKENIYVLQRGRLGTGVRIINWDDDNLGILGGGMFTWPAGLLADKDENLYVSDEAKHTVTILDPDGAEMGCWGRQGSGPGELNRPSGLAFDGEGNIVLADTMNHRIQRFSLKGDHLQSFGCCGAQAGELNMPWGVAVDVEGNIYVADWRNDRVQKFSGDGSSLMSIGSTGKGKGQFNRPCSVAVDAHGDIYVSDWQNNRVQLFNKEGRYVEQFLGGAGLSKSGQTYVLANPNTLRLRDMADIESTRRLSVPTAVKIDAEFRLLICDFGNHRIQVYKKDAVELTKDQIAPPIRNPVLFTT